MNIEYPWLTAPFTTYLSNNNVSVSPLIEHFPYLRITAIKSSSEAAPLYFYYKNNFRRYILHAHDFGTKIKPRKITNFENILVDITSLRDGRDLKSQLYSF